MGPKDYAIAWSEDTDATARDLSQARAASGAKDLKSRSTHLAQREWVEEDGGVTITIAVADLHKYLIRARLPKEPISAHSNSNPVLRHTS
jgi:hypothetical protein